MIYGIGYFYIGDTFGFTDAEPDDLSEICVFNFSLSENIQLKTYRYLDVTDQVFKVAERSLVPDKKQYKLSLELQNFDFATLADLTGATVTSNFNLGTPVYVKGTEIIDITSTVNRYAYNITTCKCMTEITSGTPTRNQFLANLGSNQVSFATEAANDTILFVNEVLQSAATLVDQVCNYRTFIGLAYTTKGVFHIKIDKMQQENYLNLTTESKSTIDYVILDKNISIYKI